LSNEATVGCRQGPPVEHPGIMTTPCMLGKSEDRLTVGHLQHNGVNRAARRRVGVPEPYSVSFAAPGRPTEGCLGQ
jgi:hypothetical protein